MTQETLLELPRREPPAEPAAEEPPGPPKLKPVDRQQLVMRVIDVEAMLPADHRARAIWELTGRLDLSGFAQGLRSQEGKAGRPCWDPRLLVSVWVYAYSEGISSAREIERVMAHEPGLMWLSALGVINHHTLADFRAGHEAALQTLFRQLLAVLEAEGMVDLAQVMVDGTKIRAQASAGSFCQADRLQQHLERARAAMEQIEQAAKEGRSVREAAQQRAARERRERLEQAAAELAKMQPRPAGLEKKADSADAPPAAEEEVQPGSTASKGPSGRVSRSEPEARVMKQPDGGYAPSYNVQVSTEARHGVVVGVHLTQEANDVGQLEPAVEQVQETTGRLPGQVVADGGYASRDNVVKMAAQGVDLVSSLADEQKKARAALKGRGVTAAFWPEAFRWEADSNGFVCPAGNRLEFERYTTREAEHRFAVYRAAGQDCAACAHRGQCCPKQAEQGRTVSRVVNDHPAMVAFREKMAQAQARQIYKRRAAVAEPVNAWLKEKLRLRRFRLRGIVKAGLEVLWACVAYNLRQWIRLRWQPRPVEVGA